jgi:hypothetical protein
MEKARPFLTATQGYYEVKWDNPWDITLKLDKQCINMGDDLIHLHILTGEFGVGKNSFEITFLRGVQVL